MKQMEGKKAKVGKEMLNASSSSESSDSPLFEEFEEMRRSRIDRTSEFWASEKVCHETVTLYIDHLNREMRRMGIRFPGKVVYIEEQLPEFFIRFEATAEVFGASNQRQELRQLIRGSNLDDLTYEKFSTAMNILVKERINLPKLIALFYACSDMNIKALTHTNLNTYRNVKNYIAYYLTRIIPPRIEAEGGWEYILRPNSPLPPDDTIYYLSIFGIAVCATTALLLFVYFKRR